MSGEVDGERTLHVPDSVPAARSTGAVRRSSRHATPGVRLPSGHVIAGRYRIEELLGEGGMGTVFRAAHLSLRKDVAVKVMRPELAADTTMAARFEREAYASSRIQHPNVVVVHDFGRDGDLLYLVMELLEGESLGVRIERDGACGIEEALRTTSHVLRALAAAHALGIVHRDLKPDNVHVDKSGTYKVLDFGIARILDDTTVPESAGKVTMAGMIVGTPLYMSPEMVARKPVGPAADLYALGVMLFEMITGTPPFLDDQPIVVMSRHLTEDPPRMSAVAPKAAVPARVDALVRRLLDKEPNARGTAAEMLAEVDAIRAAVASGDVSVAAPAPFRSDAPPRAGAPVALAPTPTATPQRSRGVATALILVGLVVVIGGTIWAAMLASNEETPDEPAVVAPDETPAPDETADESPTAVEPATVTARFTVKPESARIVSPDGELVDGALVLPRDGLAHPVRIEATGYQARTYDVVADVDREILVELRRVGTAATMATASPTMTTDLRPAAGLSPRDRRALREARRARMEARAAMEATDVRPRMRDTGLRTEF